MDTFPKPQVLNKEEEKPFNMVIIDDETGFPVELENLYSEALDTLRCDGCRMYFPAVMLDMIKVGGENKVFCLKCKKEIE
jgi:hypothetical protein